jgi:hypothetical protein
MIKGTAIPQSNHIPWLDISEPRYWVAGEVLGALPPRPVGHIRKGRAGDGANGVHTRRFSRRSTTRPCRLV